jgi:hypothetical protein
MPNVMLRRNALVNMRAGPKAVKRKFARKGRGFLALTAISVGGHTPAVRRQTRESGRFSEAEKVDLPDGSGAR